MLLTAHSQLGTMHIGEKYLYLLFILSY